jgi:hypothetical protein
MGLTKRVSHAILVVILFFIGISACIAGLLDRPNERDVYHGYASFLTENIAAVAWGCTLCLLAWCSIFVRSDPILTRIAIISVIFCWASLLAIS